VSFGDLDPAQMDAYIAAFEQAIAGEVASFAPDVIHAQHAWILSALCTRTGVPTVVTVHGTDLMGCTEWPALAHYATEALGSASSIVCISDDNEALVRSMFPAQAGKTHLIRNGYNSGIFKPRANDRNDVLARHGIDARNRRVVLFAGKLTEFKGVDVLLDAAAIYERDEADAITVIAGDGELRRELEEQAETNGLERTFFIGNVTQSEPAELYSCADLFAMPSRREPFGLVALEAMACGSPVVASDEGGLPDFVNGAVGALVAPEDPEVLAGAIGEVLGRAAEGGAAWRDSIARYAHDGYSQEKMMGEFLALYRDAAESAHWLQMMT
jgi:glycosyltransferase involved in cell wall biosynthesis